MSLREFLKQLLIRSVNSVIGMPIWKQVLVRGSRTFLQSFLGLLPTATMYAQDFGMAALTAASLSVGPTVVAVGWNLLELLNRLDETRPELRA
jgi:hypothetical protein